MRFLGESATQAADAVMGEIRALGGSGGVIVVSASGEGISSFTTPGMYRGEASPEGRSVAIYRDESASSPK
jgi:beta-aspartyl-peptidase (threonine type)